MQLTSLLIVVLTAAAWPVTAGAQALYDATCDQSGLTQVFREEIAAAVNVPPPAPAAGCRVWSVDLPASPPPRQVVLADRRRAAEIAARKGLKVLNANVALAGFFLITEARGLAAGAVPPDVRQWPTVKWQRAEAPTLFWVQSPALSESIVKLLRQKLQQLTGELFTLTKEPNYTSVNTKLRNTNNPYRRQGFVVVVPVADAAVRQLPTLPWPGLVLRRLQVAPDPGSADPGVTGVVYPTAGEFDLALLRDEGPERRMDQSPVGRSGLGPLTPRYPAVLVDPAGAMSDRLQVAMARAYLRSADVLSTNAGYPLDVSRADAQLVAVYLREASVLSEALARTNEPWQPVANAVTCAEGAYQLLTETGTLSNCAMAQAAAAGCDTRSRELARRFAVLRDSPSEAAFADALSLCSIPIHLQGRGLFTAVYEPYLPLASFRAGRTR